MPELSQSDHHLYLYTKVNKEFEENIKDDILQTSHSTSPSSSKGHSEESFLSRSASSPLHTMNSSMKASHSAPLHSSIFINDMDNQPCSNSNAIPSLEESKIVHENDTDTLNPNKYFNFLDDFIRFDICRTGVSCFSGYTVGVQYEDDFLVGRTGAPCYLSMACSPKSRVRLWHNGKAFEVEYLPRVSCTRPKDCTYEVKIRGEEEGIGTIHFKDDLVHIYNAYERCLSLRRKQGSSCYSIKTEAGDRLAAVEIFRGLRGDILYYGLSILGDASSTDKALLIGLTVAMDIRQRESDMRCFLIWVPLCCLLVIGVFSFLPWLYFHDEKT